MLRMNSLSKKQILFTISALVAVLGVFAVVTGYRPGEEAEKLVPAATTTTTALSGGGSVKVGSTGAFTVSSVPEVSTGGAALAPDLRAPLVISQDMSPEAQTILRGKFADAQIAVAKDPKNFQALITLGTWRKMAGDYAGAAADWNYAAALYPKDASVYDNLGSLYQDFLKDHAKAEAAYLTAIKNRPADLNAYRSLYALYTDYGYKADTNAGEQILKQGIAANPKAADLQVLLARYYAAHKNPAAARTEYDSAITAAKAAGQTDVAAQLSAEEGKL